MEVNGSSLKNFNFEGMTTEEIINKYESVLSNRENQLLSLTIEIGNANSEINKIEKNIAQELNNKDIMFMRLQQKESEVEFLQMQLDALVKGTNIKPTEEKKIVKNEETGFFSSAKNKMKALKEKAMGKIKKIDFNDLIGVKSNKDENNNNNINNENNNNNNINNEINNENKNIPKEENKEENKEQ